MIDEYCLWIMNGFKLISSQQRRNHELQLPIYQRMKPRGVCILCRCGTWSGRSPRNPEPNSRSGGRSSRSPCSVSRPEESSCRTPNSIKLGVGIHICISEVKHEIYTYVRNSTELIVPERNNRGNEDAVRRPPCEFLAWRHPRQCVWSLARPRGKHRRSSRAIDEMNMRDLGLG